MNDDEKKLRRWLKALGIAKIIFEDQGYHTKYLEEIENFIEQEFIPILFKIALTKRISMTKLVKNIIEEYLDRKEVKKEEDE